jgi:hypothetical protein
MHTLTEREPSIAVLDGDPLAVGREVVPGLCYIIVMLVEVDHEVPAAPR